jgi:hypothetical protein
MSAAAVVYVVQGRYSTWGSRTWDDECEEGTRAEGLARLKEYRENGMGEYRMITRRVRAGGGE